VSNVQVKNLESEVHDLLRERAVAVGLTISDYVLELIRRDLRLPSRRQWLTAVGSLPQHDFSRADVSRADFNDVSIDPNEPMSRLSRLVNRPDVVVGDSADFVHLDWSSEWRG
jgi:hypothetical protein